MNGSEAFYPNSENSIAIIRFAGYADTSSPRLHAKDTGFLFEYILSGEECFESPDFLVRAGIGNLVVVHPSEECVIYKSRESVSVLSFQISGFVLEAAAEVLALPRIVSVSADILNKLLPLPDIYSKYISGDTESGRYLCETAFSLLLHAAEGRSADFSKKKPSAEIIRDYLDLCLCGDIDLNDVGEKFGITGMHVIRLFRGKFDITPMQYLKLKRLEKSTALLLESDMSIKEIASLLRFSSTQHFTNMFRERFGVSPGKYRDKKQA